MEMLELECPNCKELLELDVGFAGGVCRCSACAILMTVPSNPEIERAEKLIRPEAPTDRMKRGTGGEAAGAGEGAEQTDSQTYLTESGRRVEIEAGAVIPTAQKRKRPAVRATVAAVFAAVMGVMVVGCLFALWVLVVNPVDPNRRPGEEILTQYDPGANPYRLEKPNVVGLPLRLRAAVVIDTSIESREWLGLVKEAVTRGSGFEMSWVSLQVVLGVDGGAEAYPDEPVALRDLEAEGLKRFFSGQLARGRADLAEAVDRALQGRPQQVVLILGRDLGAIELDKIRQMLKARSGVEFDVLMIGWPITPEIDSLKSEAGGKRVHLPLQRLKDWHRAGW